MKKLAVLSIMVLLFLAACGGNEEPTPNAGVNGRSPIQAAATIEPTTTPATGSLTDTWNLPM